MGDYYNMSIDDLYNKYIEYESEIYEYESEIYEYESEINKIKDPVEIDKLKIEIDKLNIEIDKLKIEIENIRNVLDDKDLDTERLKQLHLREYQPYPEYNNSEFNMDISKKLEFNANKLYYNEQTTCGKNNFELGNHQRLLYNFMNKNTPYKSLLIFHGVGVGKTCTAVKISESFRDIHAKENNRIIVLRKGGLGEGWKRTIFDPKMGDNQCSGHEFLDLINETKGFEKRDDKSIKRDVNKLIRRFYEFYAYREFSNSINKMTKKCKDEDEEKNIIKHHFSNRLLIVDEYHNLRDDGSNSKEENDEQKKALKNLLKIVKYADNLRLVLLTATPMYNMSDEIFNLLNILLLNDNRPTIDYKQYIKDDKINEDGLQILEKKFRGYVSYLRGENPVNFPLRIYPTDYKDTLALKPRKCPKINLFGDRIVEKMKFLNTYENILEGEQKTAYEVLLKQLDKDKKLGIQDSNLKQICNIYYPSKKNTYGEEGFKSVFNESKHKFTYKKGVPHVLDYKNLNNYSIKIKNIIDNIKDSEGIIFIYSEYIWGGAIPMGLALEHLGFNKYGNKNLLNISDRGDKKGTYIILSKNDKVSDNNDEEIKIVVSPENKDGDIIKVIIGSSITGEGMDFKNIRQIHVLDPWWHLSKLEQIIGRGIRYCSHINLPKENRNVTVFLHTATCEGKETIDHYSYRLGERKSVEIGKIETILKKNAIDCYLFKGTNVILNKNLKMDVKVSKNCISKFKIPISDKPYSKICSYQSECDYSENVNRHELDTLKEIVDPTDVNEYKKNMIVSFMSNNILRRGIVKEIDEKKNKVCVEVKRKNNEKIIVKKSPYDLNILNKVNDDTINFNYFKDLERNILVYLNELYSKNKYYNLEEIVEYIQYKKYINNKIIYNILKNIINFKQIIYDETNNPGCIICKNEVYIYQPKYNNDEFAPYFYRNSVNISNKINIDIISDNIKEQIDPLKDKKIIEKQDVNTIITNIDLSYKVLLNHKFFKEYDLVKVEYKQAIFNLCLDKLSYIQKKELLIKIINEKLNKIKKPDNDKLSLIDDEINYFIYDYFKNNLYQYSDDSVPKPVLFNYDKDPEGFILINDNGELIYFDKTGNDIPGKDLSESITKLKTLFKSRRNNIYIEPYVYKKGEKYIKTYKIFDEKSGITVGKNSGDSTSVFNRFRKLNLDRFKELNEDVTLFKSKTIKGINLTNQDKYDIFHLIFRIKDLLNDDNKIYVVSNELSYLNK